MRLTRFSDYSLRVLIYLAVREERSSIAEVGRSFNVSENHLMKVVHRLSTLGYIESTRGKKGGIELGMDPKKINLGKIIVELEPDFDIAECFNEASDHCRISPVCVLKKFFDKAKKAFLRTLEQYSLADVVQNRTQLANLICPS
jgi:Rrf2 family nitric oxide-sensitive transcriptional repressor